MNIRNFKKEILLEAKDIRKYPSHFQKWQDLRLFLFLVNEKKGQINVTQKYYGNGRS